MNMRRLILSGSIGALTVLLAGPALADCSQLPNWSTLKTALVGSITSANGGLGFNMWATLIANDGTVCAVAFSGQQYTDQWLGSRVISAQKANTANDFSLGPNTSPTGAKPGLALSTANLFSAVQPGGSLYGLQHSNPVDTEVAYANPDEHNGLQRPGWGQGPADARLFGTQNDPMVGLRIGGVNVFGGGLAAYSGGVKVGAVGVSGDTSCTDHMVAWRLRHALNLDHFGTVTGPAALFAGDPTHPDNIIFDITPNADGTGGTGQMPNGSGGVGTSASGFGHPKCLTNPNPATLPPVSTH